MKADLIAPCGMNCNLCYGYIRPRNKCSGCRATNENKPKSCAECKIVVCEKRVQNNWETCAFCDTPCRRLKDLDKRYSSKYHMSMIENLAAIRDYGMSHFLQMQDGKYRCGTCGEVLCVHRDECPTCRSLAWHSE